MLQQEFLVLVAMVEHILQTQEVAVVVQKVMALLQLVVSAEMEEVD